MNTNIEKYNASFPIEFYVVGEIYSFYGGKSAKGSSATKKQILKYGEKLLQMVDEENSDAIKPVNYQENKPSETYLERYYGIVIEKSSSQIKVMHLNLENGRKEFVVRKYVTGMKCAMDGKELMPIASYTEKNGDIKVNKASAMGQITKLKAENRVGQITRKSNTYNRKESDKIGEITKMQTKESVSGITKVKKDKAVSGITKIKKENKISGITKIR